MRLRDDLPLDAVTAVQTKTYGDAITFCDNPAPATPLEARFSLQHCIAVALIGGPPGLADFEPPAIADPRLVALRAKMAVAEDDAFTRAFPQRYGAELRVSLADGSTRDVEVKAAKGDPDNPMSRAEIEAKAQDLMTAAGLSEDAIRRLAEGCLGLAQGGPLAALTIAREFPKFED